MHVASIHVYPVKSLAGQSVARADVEPSGLRHDRRWLVLQPDGKVLTAREEHRLLGIAATPTEAGLELRSTDGRSHAVRTPVDGELVPTSTSRLDSVRLASRDAHRWLSDLLERPVRLAWLDDPRRRSVSTVHGGTDGDSLSLADAAPLLLTSTRSLEQLNDWVEPPAAIGMARFRPNVIVDDVPDAFEEDAWRAVRIGASEFRFAEICDRCVMTTLDPETLLGGKEPLRTLARYRQWDHKTWFGIRVIPLAPGAIRVGDSVEVLARA